MLDIDEIKTALQDRNILAVARATELHSNILYRIKKGNTKNPSQKTLKALSDYLQGKK